jgi:flagellar assembly protein FliH
MSGHNKTSAEHAISDITKVLSADQVSSPQVHKWHFSDLEQDAKQQMDSLRAEVLAKIKQEIQPKLAQQTAILKREAYEEAKQQGYEVGYQAGFETGQTLGIDKAKQQAEEVLKPKVAQLEQVLQSFSKPQQYIETRVFEQVANIAIMLAEKLTEQAIEVDKTKLLHFIEQAVALLPDEDARIEVELHPDDLEVVQFYQVTQKQDWLLKSNPKLSPGDCRVKKLNSVVDYRWRERLAQLVEQTVQLVETRLEPDSDDDDLAETDASTVLP